MSRVIVMAITVVTIVASSLGSLGGQTAVPIDQWMPPDANGFLSIPDLSVLRQHFQQTRLGHLVRDEAMKPFVEQVRERLRQSLLESDLQLSATYEELESIVTGEVALAIFAAPEQGQKPPVVLAAYVAGRETQALELIERAAEQLQKKGAERSVILRGAHQLVLHRLPRQKGQAVADVVVRFLANGYLVVTNHQPTADALLVRVTAPSSTEPSLASSAAYKAIMARTLDATQGKPQLGWFIEPFGYGRAVRAAIEGERKRGKDLLAILERQGFDAIRGVGGRVYLATDRHEYLHRTMIFAPPLSDSQQRFQLAARMLTFPNRGDLEPPDWVPRELASYISLHWDMMAAFDYSETLVDALAGDEGFFDDLMSSIMKDPYGPQINIREELIAYFADRAIILSDNVVPVTPQSERVLVAIALNDADAVAQTVRKAFEDDPDARQLQIAGHTVFEIVNPEESPVPNLDIDAGGLTPLEEATSEEEEHNLPNMAVTVVHGHLMVATHVDFLRRVLEPYPESSQLKHSGDYQLVREHLDALGAEPRSFLAFVRTDESSRTTYELIRQGKMPEAETLLGKLLNRMLGPKEKGILRQQKIDGSKLPDYQLVRRYLGPAGWYVQSDDSGWLLTGILLSKQAPYLADEQDSLRTATTESLETEEVKAQ